MHFKQIVALVALVAFVTSCGAAAMHTSDVSYKSTPMKKASADFDKLIIYNADVWFEVDDYDLTHSAIAKLVESYQGYLVEQRSTYVKVRVDATKFKEFMGKLEAVEGYDHKKTYMFDKTAEYKDVKIRLDNAVKFKAQYEELMKKAVTVEEMLKIEKELERVTEKIETLKGQIDYLENQALYSTVKIYIQDDVTPGPVGWIFYGLWVGVKWLFVWD